MSYEYSSSVRGLGLEESKIVLEVPHHDEAFGRELVWLLFRKGQSYFPAIAENDKVRLIKGDLVSEWHHRSGEFLSVLRETEKEHATSPYRTFIEKCIKEVE